MIIFQKPHFAIKTEKSQKLFSFEIPLTAFVFGGFYFFVRKNFSKKAIQNPETRTTSEGTREKEK